MTSTHTINLTDERATLSPAWLRKVAQKPTAVILVAEPKLSMLADAIEIADEAAEAHVDSETLHVDEEGLTSWDLSSVDPEFKATVDKLLSYLEARGLLQRHPSTPELARVQEITD